MKTLNKKTVKPSEELDRSRLFALLLLDWNQLKNNRKMPWKGEKDPYKIWLSEIILQQTRVEQGWKYYEAFVQAFPTIEALAKAPEQQVFKLWEGLGYYSRCRNLIATSKHIVENEGGIFPGSYDSILSLKGVGPYTAAAIASFAYNLPFAVLDGNVFRVLSRIHGIEVATDSTEGKKLFARLAQDTMPEAQAGVYNQAIMDFGATVCKPAPECDICFFKSHCIAFKENKQALLPLKKKKIQIKERWFHYIIIEYDGSILIHQRHVKDIWQELHEPLLIEAEHQLNKNAVLQQLEKSYGIYPSDYEVISAAANATQKLTHQTVHFSFIHLLCKKQFSIPGFDWVEKQKIAKFAFPKTIQSFLSKNLI